MSRRQRHIPLTGKKEMKLTGYKPVRHSNFAAEAPPVPLGFTALPVNGGILQNRNKICQLLFFKYDDHIAEFITLITSQKALTGYR